MTRITLHNRLAYWARTSTPRGREIVLEILKSAYPVPIHSHEIYERVRKEYPDEKIVLPPPVPPIQSRYPATIKSSSKKKDKPPALPPPPPHPDHPIRSYKFMKSVILEDLAQRRQVTKVHSMREPTPEELAMKKQRSKGKKKGADAPTVIINVKGMIDQWGWTLKTPKDKEAETQERLRIQKAIEGQKSLDPKKLEEAKRKQFAEEWGHLNVRRRRARSGKLEREEEWARILESGRQEGRAEVQQKPA